MDVQTASLGLTVLKARSSAQAVVESALPLPPGRDAAAALMVHGAARLTEAACGKDAVEVAGELLLTLLCTDPSGEPFGFTAGTTFAQTVELPDVLPSMRAEAAAQVLECECEPEGERVRLSMVIELSITVLAPVTTPFVAGISGAEPGLETLSGELVQRRRTLMGKSNLRMRETVEAPGARRTLTSFASGCIDDISFTGGTANVSGAVFLTVLYEAETGELLSIRATLPFTDAFDALPLAERSGEITVKSLSVVAAEAGFGVCDVELTLEIALYGVEEITHRALLDAYDGKGSFSCAQIALDQLQYGGTLRQRSAISEAIAVPKHLPEVQTPLFCSAMPAVTGVDSGENGVGVDVMLLITIVYRCEAGYLHSFTEDVPVRFLLEGAGGSIMDARVQILSCSLTGSGRLLTAELSTEAAVDSYTPERTQLASEVIAGGEQPKYRGILIYCADGGETLWDVGKQFLSPVADILKWNGELPDPLPEGKQIVLIR